MPYLFDTNTCIEILRGKNSAVLARYAGHARADLAVSAVVRSELIAGALLSAKRDENRRLAEAFCALFPCLPFDAQVANIHAEWHAKLRRQGNLIGSHDLMIATTALAHHMTLVTHNVSEFKRIDGLGIEDWQQPRCDA
jgi:tRNA(fMet)-specific endonuclease VapC